jgi:NAD(P)H dehydrogenase (quinone)
MILLTGATGKTGSATAKLLLEKAVPFRALVRNAEKAQWLKDAGVELIIGDLSDRTVVQQALTGIDRALLITVNEQNQLDMEKQFVDCAVAANVGHIVKLSAMDASADTVLQTPRTHWQSEEHIRASGLKWTMIRPSFFMQNLLPNAATIRNESKLVLPLGKGKVGFVSVNDSAALIAEALVGNGHEGQIYVFTGSESLSCYEVAGQFSEVLGREIEYHEQPLDEYRDRLLGVGLAPWRVDSIVSMFEEISSGTHDFVTDTFSKVLGREPTSFKQFIQENIDVYQ